GFANWAYEVAEQERELGVFFDTIVVCTVTGSTHAGMIAGFAALEAAGGRPRKVIGIDASATPEKTHSQVKRIANTTAEHIGLGRPLHPPRRTVGAQRLQLDRLRPEPRARTKSKDRRG